MDTTCNIAWKVKGSVIRTTVLLKEGKNGEFKIANSGEGKNLTTQSIALQNLKSSTKYTIRIITGNNFLYEEKGTEISIKTLSEDAGFYLFIYFYFWLFFLG